MKLRMDRRKKPVVFGFIVGVLSLFICCPLIIGSMFYRSFIYADKNVIVNYWKPIEYYQKEIIEDNGVTKIIKQKISTFDNFRSWEVIDQYGYSQIITYDALTGKETKSEFIDWRNYK